MPRLENIERFKETLYALGSEPELDAARPEAGEPELTPEGSAQFEAGEGAESEEPPSLGLDDLLGEPTENPPPSESPETAESEEEPGEPAFAFDAASSAGPEGLDLGDLLGEEAAESAGAEEAQPSQTEQGIEDAFFMPSLGLESKEGGGEPESGTIESQLADLFAESPAESPTEPGGTELDSGGLGDEFLPTEESAVSEPEPSTEELQLPDDFALPEPATSETEPAPEPGLEPSPEAVDLGEGTAAGALGVEDFEAAGLETGKSEGEPAEADFELGEGLGLEALGEGTGEGLEVPEEHPAEAEIEQPAEGEPAEEKPGEEQPGEPTLQDREFRAIQRNLEGLPRNLKIAVESLLGEQGYSGDALRQLLDLLVRGGSPREIAALVSTITGKTVRIPARFEKQTGVAFEEEKRSLAYLIRATVLPILRTVLLVSGLLAVLSYGAYQYVYVPLYARSLYRAGYLELENAQYGDSERHFEQAARQRNLKSWYYRYAEGLSTKKEYTLADRKYVQLEESFGYDKKELIDRARLNSTKLGNFELADELLQRILSRDYNDLEGGLARGDNFLEWAKRALPPRSRGELLEQARLQLARLIERYGNRTEILFRMMQYFVRSDRLADLQDLRAFLEAGRTFKPDPGVYAEVGGYLLDKDDVEGARTVLLKANAVDVELPEIDYSLARLYRLIDEQAEEERALQNTLVNLEEAERTPERLRMEIDARRRLGDWYYRARRYIEASGEFERAIAEIESEQTRGVGVGDAELALAYVGLGDIGYYVDSDYDRALDLYLRGRAMGLQDAALDYRIGYIRYAKGSYAQAVAELVAVQERLDRNWNVLFALGTALFQRGDYFAAEGYYLRLADRLTDRRNGIRDLRPAVNPEHFEIANLLLKTHNNLGVTYYMQGRMRGGRGNELSRALVQMTEAAVYLDVLARDPETLERSEAKNLAYLNMNGIQHPLRGFEPAIYDRIPKDTTANRF